MNQKNPSYMSKDVVRMRRLPDLPHIEIYEGSNLLRSASRHTHFFFSIGVCEDGARTHVRRGNKHTIFPGSILLVNIGEVHSGDSIDKAGYSSKAIRIDLELQKSLTSQIVGRVLERIFCLIPRLPNTFFKYTGS